MSWIRKRISAEQSSKGSILRHFPYCLCTTTASSAGCWRPGPLLAVVSVPVAVAVWATVSAEVDKKLSENLHVPIRLRPDEWQSGDILWLIDAVGDPRVVPQLLRQLVETAFKGREAKMLARAENGKMIVQRIASKE